MMVVYKLTNKTNGKAYIGQTRVSLETRLRQHMRSNSYCLALARALKKHGLASFQVEVLRECLSLEELNEYEALLMKKHKTLAPNGYNLMIPGSVRILSEETRKKLSNAGKGRVFDEPTRRKISISNSGRQVSVQSRLKMSIAKLGSASPKRKQVLDLSTGIMWSSCKEAAKAIGMTQGSLSRILSGVRTNKTSLRYLEKEN